MIKVRFSLIRPVCILHMSRALCGTPEVWEQVGCCLSPTHSHGQSGGQGRHRRTSRCAVVGAVGAAERRGTAIPSQDHEEALTNKLAFTFDFD